MTPQEAFDRAVFGTIRQGRGSYVGRVSCRYRGPDGTRCTIGRLIPDRLYNPEMEGRSARGLLKEWPIVAKHFAGVPVELLEDLQGAHDDACGAKDFAQDFILRARDIAVKYQLTYPGLP